MAGWEEFFVDGSADGIDRLVDDLAEAELEGDEAIDHAAGGVAGRGDDIFTAFDDGPGVAVEVRSYDFRGFDEGIFDAVDADFAIVLGGVAGMTRLYSGKRPSINLEVKRISPIWTRR